MTKPRTTSIGPAVAGTAQDPYPWFGRLREDGPVHRVRQPNGAEWWLVTRYEDARAMLADKRLAKNPRLAEEALRGVSFLVGESNDDSVRTTMLTTDPPDHTRLRRLVSRAFTPQRVERLRPRVQQITEELLDAIEPLQEVDLVEAFAFPLPITVICELLGVPSEDRDHFRAWTSATLTRFDVPDSRRIRREGAGALERYFRDLVERKRPNVRTAAIDDEQPDLVSALIVARDEAGRLSEQELVSMLVLLLGAGHETTVSLLSGGMLTLFLHPDQLHLLRAQPDLLPSAVEEFLRYDGPFPTSSPRIAMEDVAIGDVVIPAGSVVSVLLSSADRDGRRFEEPDGLNVARTDNQHLAFGHGIHFCLGAPLARMEGEIAFGTLLRRFPGIHLARPPDQLAWRSSSVLRGLDELPVRLR